MGTITAGAIIDQAAVALSDVNNIKWLRTELLSWLNAAQRQVILLQPHANSTRQSVQLAAGSRQSLPTGGWALLDVFRNMGTNGTTPGAAVRHVSRTHMDGFDPSWHAATAAATVKNFVYDEQDQTSFWVYPPNTGTGYVEIVYSKPPTAIVSEATAIAVSDIYEPALLDYILSRAHTKAVEFAGGPQVAAQFYQNFLSSVGAKETSQTVNSPANTLGKSAGPGANT